MIEKQPGQFTSKEQEVSYLREQLAEKERQLIERSAEVDSEDIETVGKEVLREYSSFTPKLVLEKEHQLTDHELSTSVSTLETSHDRVADILNLAITRGIHNALTVLEKMRDPYLTDEVHRELIEQIRNGVELQNLKEGAPLWHLLHMTLYEVMLPELQQGAEQKTSVTELTGLMEQWFAGLQTILNDKRGLHYVFEVAVAEHSDDIVFYVAVPNDYVSLFEKQTLSLFPHADLTQQIHDYNVFVAEGETSMSEASLKQSAVYPLRMSDVFLSDPLAVILNAFSKIDRSGGGAALQIVVQAPNQPYQQKYKQVIKRIKDGMKVHESIERSTVGGEFMASLSEMVFSSKKKKTETEYAAPTIDQYSIEIFQKKTNVCNS